MRDRHPPFAGTRVMLARARDVGGGTVAGRLSAGPPATLTDAGATVDLDALPEGTGDGDWVSGRLERGTGGRFRLVAVTVHAPSMGPSPDPDLPGRLPILERRARIVDALRAWFRERGFLEVATPSRVANPGLEPHLRAFPAGPGRWWITSPELHLKRVLAAGAERIVEFARVLRDDERGPWHLPEFTLIEWYRAWEPLSTLERDCESLLAAAADAARAPDGIRTTLRAPFQRTTVRREVRARTGLDLARLRDRDDLARAISARGHAAAEDDDWDALFFRLWIAEVEPGLGVDRPTFVHGYPASQAALARRDVDDDGFPVAARFELYAFGVELANAFDELNDPEEQRRRHEADRAARAAAGAPVHALDEDFLAALTSGMPPSSGIALGLDRLIAGVLGASSLDPVVAFPDRGGPDG